MIHVLTDLVVPIKNTYNTACIISKNRIINCHY